MGNSSIYLNHLTINGVNALVSTVDSFLVDNLAAENFTELQDLLHDQGTPITWLNYSSTDGWTSYTDLGSYIKVNGSPVSNPVSLSTMPTFTKCLFYAQRDSWRSGSDETLRKANCKYLDITHNSSNITVSAYNSSSSLLGSQVYYASDFPRLGGNTLPDVFILALQGSGGGGGGCDKYEDWRIIWTGGGGGGSGAYSIVAVKCPLDTTVRVELGRSGSGGESWSGEPGRGDGGNGEASYIKYNGTTIATSTGGMGGYMGGCTDSGSYQGGAGNSGGSFSIQDSSLAYLISGVAGAWGGYGGCWNATNNEWFLGSTPGSTNNSNNLTFACTKRYDTSQFTGQSDNNCIRWFEDTSTRGLSGDGKAGGGAGVSVYWNGDTPNADNKSTTYYYNAWPGNGGAGAFPSQYGICQEGQGGGGACVWVYF